MSKMLLCTFALILSSGPVVQELQVTCLCPVLSHISTAQDIELNTGTPIFQVLAAEKTLGVTRGLWPVLNF